MASSLFLGPPSSLPRAISRPFRDHRRRPLACRAAASSGGAAVVWLKHDLRVDDHLGFVDAVKESRLVVPVYVLDRRILSS